MLFEWDPHKAVTNFKKHGVSFEVATLVFQDRCILSVVDERFSYQEQRWHSLGMVTHIVLFVAHTLGVTEYGEENIRIISARKATSREQQRYFAYRQNARTITQPRKNRSKT